MIRRENILEVGATFLLQCKQWRFEITRAPRIPKKDECNVL